MAWREGVFLAYLYKSYALSKFPGISERIKGSPILRKHDSLYLKNSLGAIGEDIDKEEKRMKR